MNLRKSLWLLLLLIPALTWGQQADSNLTQAEKNLNRLTKMYDLSSEQQDQAKTIFAQFRNDRDRLKVSSRSKEAKRAEHQKLVQQRKDAIYSILNADQQKKLDRNKDRQAKRMKKKQSRKSQN